MEDADHDDGSNNDEYFDWKIVVSLYSLPHKQRLLGLAPHLTLTEVIDAEFLRRAQLGELFQEPSDQERLYKRLRKVGFADDELPMFNEEEETIDHPSGDENNNNNNDDDEDEETPATETTATGSVTTGSGTKSTEDENCKKRTVMDCYSNQNNNQEQNYDDDNNKSNINNITIISPSPKRCMTRTAAKKEAEENKAILETTPTPSTTTNRGASSTAEPNETSPLVNVRHGRPEPPGRCAGVVVPHSIREQSATANSGATGAGMPIHTIFQWCDSQLRERMTILVVLPTGVNTRYTVAVRGGTKLEIVFQWPEMSFNPDQVQELVQRRMEMERENNGNSRGLDPGTLQDHMIQHQEFRRHIQHLERQMDHRMESKVEIPLPKTVHAHGMEINAIGRIDDGTRMLYINLFCECTESIHKQQGTPFVLV